MNKLATLSLPVILLLTACGGGGGGGGGVVGNGGNGGDSPQTDSNVALASAGASASATYDNGNAGLVNDGDNSTSNFWAGNITGDSVTIDFGSVKDITSITVYTNSTTFNSTNPDKRIEISEDGNTWSLTAQLTGGDLGCASASMASGRIECTLADRTDARYIRFTTTATSNVGLIQVYEMEVQGR